MADQDDLFVGRTAFEEGLVTDEQLLESLIDLAEEGRARDGHVTPRMLGTILVQHGYLRKEDLKRILEKRGKVVDEPADRELGRVLVDCGYVSPEQVEEGLEIQRRSPGRHLGEILIERCRLAPDQLQQALASVVRSNYVCHACGARFNVPYAQPGGRYACRGCGKLLRPVGSGPPAGEPAEIERAMALYIRQKNMIRPEILRDAEKLLGRAAACGIKVSLLEILTRRKLVTWQQADQLRKVDLAGVLETDAWRRQVVPGYRIVDKIAMGGFAAIFSADPFFGKGRVVVKILHRQRARQPAAVDRFHHEARLMMSLDHPHIVRAYEHGEHQGLHYILMELVEGRSLERVVLDGGRLAFAAALKVVRQVAEALLYLQREGYIHRDMKPENILLDRKGSAKVCDLGFATPIRTRPVVGTRELTLGTAAYVSPEQARGEIDLKVGTDIYSLGLTLYFMLTGHVPFDGQDADVVMAERFSKGVAAPDFSLLRSPEPVLAVVRKMLHPEREQRFTTYPELLAAMEALPR